MKSVVKYLRARVPAMSLGLFIKITGTVVELLLPWMLSVIIDRYVPQRDLKNIIIWGGFMVIAAVVAFYTNTLANRMATRVARDFIREVRTDLFAKITDLSCAQIDRFTIPSLISRVTSDSYNLHQMVDRMQRLGVRGPIMLLGGIIITLIMEPVLTLIMIAIIPLIGLIVVQISRKGIRSYTKTQTALDGMIRRAQESISGIRVIQALSKTDYEKKRFGDASVSVADNDYQAALLMNVTNPVINFLLNLGVTLVVLVGAYGVNGGNTSAGVIVAFLSYFTIILNAMMMASRMFVMFTKGVASGKRIAEVLDAPHDMDVRECPPAPGDAHIRFDSVSFSYSKVRDNLSNISFTLDRGETLGIIGATGSGKSALLQLLLRFYDPDSGAIYLGGRDLRSIPEDELHTRFGAVFQSDFLYADNIKENIDIGRGLDDARIRKAACAAQAAGFIENRNGGFTGEIASGGTDLSGGQKQRLLIARAMASDPEILLLDDSSSALDYKTDAALRQALKNEFRGVTKVIIAQRVSAIRNADKILVLDGGREIGFGSHDELMRDCATYREIAVFQMQEVE